MINREGAEEIGDIDNDSGIDENSVRTEPNRDSIGFLGNPQPIGFVDDYVGQGKQTIFLQNRFQVVEKPKTIKLMVFMQILLQIWKMLSLIRPQFRFFHAACMHRHLSFNRIYGQNKAYLQIRSK